jgi:outer membrane protein assembly factor BamB
MRSFYFLLLFTLGALRSNGQEALPFFSDLSNQPAFRPTFDAVTMGQDLYYLINDDGIAGAIVYKLNADGDVVVTRQLEAGYYHYGNLFTYNNRLFFDGLRVKDTLNSDHALLEFDADLNIVLSQNWPDLVPDKAGMFIYRGAAGLISFDRGARMIRNDTLYSVMPYALDVSGLGPFLPRTMYEVLGLDGSVYYTKFLKNIDSLYYHTYTSIGEDAFYLFGYMEGPTVPGGDSFSDGGLMGRFNLQTGVVEGTSWYNDPFLGNGTDGGMGQYLNGRIYCSSYTATTLEEAEYAGSGCPERTVVLEARTANLALIKGYNLPTCGFVTNGGKAFATDSDGFIYYANYNFSEGLTYVFKFDSLLNPVWQKKYAIKFPYSILHTAQGYLVLNCISDIFSPVLEIHRIDGQDGELVGSTELPMYAPETLAYYPNPFKTTVQTDLTNAQTGRLLVFNQQGQLVVEMAPPCSQVNLATLPVGSYLLRLLDPVSLRVMGQQWLVKGE